MKPIEQELKLTVDGKEALTEVTKFTTTLEKDSKDSYTSMRAQHSKYMAVMTNTLPQLSKQFEKFTNQAKTETKEISKTGKKEMSRFKAYVIGNLTSSAIKGAISGLRRGIGGIARLSLRAATSGIRGFTGLVKQSSLLAAEQERVEKMLSSAMKVNNSYSVQAMQGLKDFASQMQKVTVVGDETTLGLMQVAMSMGVQDDKMKETIKGAIGLSRAFGIDLNSALKMVSLGVQGDYTLLQRYVPQLRFTKDATEKAAIFNNVLAKSFKIAKEETETTKGVMQQFSNAAGDLKETLGKAVNEALKPLYKTMTNIAQSKGVKAMFEGIGKAVAGPIAGVHKLIKSFSLVMRLAGDMKTALSGGKINSEEYKSSIDAILTYFKTTFGIIINQVKDEVFKHLMPVINKLLDGLKLGLAAALEMLGENAPLAKMLGTNSIAKKLKSSTATGAAEDKVKLQNVGELLTKSPGMDLDKARQMVDDQFDRGMKNKSGKTYESYLKYTKENQAESASLPEEKDYTSEYAEAAAALNESLKTTFKDNPAGLDILKKYDEEIKKLTETGTAGAEKQKDEIKKAVDEASKIKTNVASAAAAMANSGGNNTNIATGNINTTGFAGGNNNIGNNTGNGGSGGGDGLDAIRSAREGRLSKGGQKRLNRVDKDIARAQASGNTEDLEKFKGRRDRILGMDKFKNEEIPQPEETDKTSAGGKDKKKKGITEKLEKVGKEAVDKADAGIEKVVAVIKELAEKVESLGEKVEAITEPG